MDGWMRVSVGVFNHMSLISTHARPYLGHVALLHDELEVRVVHLQVLQPLQQRDALLVLLMRLAQQLLLLPQHALCMVTWPWRGVGRGKHKTQHKHTGSQQAPPMQAKQSTTHPPTHPPSARRSADTARGSRPPARPRPLPSPAPAPAPAAPRAAPAPAPAWRRAGGRSCGPHPRGARASRPGMGWVVGGENEDTMDACSCSCFPLSCLPAAPARPPPPASPAPRGRLAAAARPGRSEGRRGSGSCVCLFRGLVGVSVVTCRCVGRRTWHGRKLGGPLLLSSGMFAKPTFPTTKPSTKKESPPNPRPRRTSPPAARSAARAPAAACRGGTASSASAAGTVHCVMYGRLCQKLRQ